MNEPTDDAPIIPGQDSERSADGDVTLRTSSGSSKTPKERQKGRPGSASPETRAEIMAILATENPPSFREIERRYGVRASTVHGWTKSRKEALEHTDEATATSTGEQTERDYRRRTRRALPVRKRVEILKEIAQGVPFTVECDAEHVDATGKKVKCGNVLRFKLPAASASERLKAVQYLDELEGLVSAKARREIEAGGSSVQPLFGLPPGTMLAAMVAPVSRPNPTTGSGQAVPDMTRDAK